MHLQSARARGRTDTYGVGVLSRILAGTATVVGAVVMTAGLAGAEPPAPGPPPAPNVNAWPPVSPAEFTAMNGTWYAFGAPGGLTVSCGTDGTMTTCVDAHNGAGFVISPTASFVLQPSNPLLLPREGRNPYVN